MPPPGAPINTAPTSNSAGRDVVRPSGAGPPWEAGLLPVAAWSALIGAVYFAMICVAVILRRQWIEREKLIYPLAQLPLDMVRASDEQRLPPFFKSTAMWIGFAIPCVISSTNAINNNFHDYPDIYHG